MAYLAPIHRPSSVRHALKLQFLSPEEDCLVVAKSNRLEFYTITEGDGIALQFSRVLYGKVTMLQKIRPMAAPTEHLFVGTDRAMYFTLSWDPGSKQLKTEMSYMDLADRTARESQTGDRCLLDPTNEFFTLEVYEGIITTMSLVKKDRKKHIIESGVLGEPAVSRIPEFFVRSSAFLPRAGEKPRLALLHEDYDSKVRLKIRELTYAPGNGSDPIVEFDDDKLGPHSHPMDMGASIIIPIAGPPYGLLILGETSISYFNDSNYRIITRPLDEATIFVAWEQIDTQRYVLADDYGKLYLLMLMLDFEENVQEWRVDVIGETPRASVLVYLDAGCLFLGSYQGDSQVIRIVDGGSSRGGGNGSVEVLQTFSNIGPILDFTIMDMGNRSGEGQVNEYSSGQARIVTGSGAWKDGSLRSVRSGVGMEELGILAEMEHVTNMFSLKSDPSSAYVNTLLVSFINESRVFFFGEDGNVEELAEHRGLLLTEQTLLATNLPDALLLQVTSTSVRITDLDSSMVRSVWSPEASGQITAVAATEQYVVVSIDGTTLQVLALADRLTPHSQRTFSADEQLACVTISPSLPDVCVIGFWQDSIVSVLDIHTLKTLQSTTTSDDAIPRNLLITNLFPAHHPPTLLVAMADGNVVTYDMNPSTYDFGSKKSTILGTQQANFKALPRGNGTHSVFATCEHPSLIYASEERIVFSAVTAEKAVCVCPFDSVAYPGAVAIASSEDLRVAIIDTERTTHVQTLSVNETVRRIAYSPNLKAFGLGTIKRTLRDGMELVESHFKLADEVLFKELDTYKLNVDELVECVMRAELNDGTGSLAERFVIGTAYLDDAFAENLRGRILVFEVVENRILKLITELPLKGACRCLAMVDGNIAAALIKTVVIYSFDYNKNPSHGTLTKKCTYRTATAPIDIAVTGNLIAIADLMKSVSVIEYKRGREGLPDILVEVARHYQTTWGTAVASVGQGLWLEGDAEGNLLVLAKEEEGVSEEDRRRLRVVGEVGLGEMVNRIRSVDVVGVGGAVIVPRAFLGTVDGSIYLFGLISQERQNFLMQLQANLAECVASPGNIPFNFFRGFRNQIRQAEEPMRFVDGELIEKFLDCSDEVQERVVRGLGVEVGEVRDLVEGLRRLC
ncbi:hypothetical protein EJ08DRAFT_735649 [Tothia fuscella]|uniref:DNA damage-binding protein 1 n=1 Tax=Tothia fuscella TaxID=1048955 RepID=A0A9P4NMG8_9PEZI|nr:hypothetical protein EJ08DRAFT_735649 [Tothia fuscella]